MRTAFPFYPSLDQQARNLSICQGERIYALIAPHDRFLPFAFRRPIELSNVECCIVYRADNDAVVLYLQPAQVGITLYKDTLYEYVVYGGGLVPDLDLDCGLYYLKVDSYYSEVFRVNSDLTPYTKLEWRNETNLGEILYQTGFTNKLYLETPITRLAPQLEQKGNTDPVGNFVPEFQRLVRRFELVTVPVPAYLHDALMFMQIHDQVQIGTYVNVQQVQIESDNMSACNAMLTIAFEEQDVTIAKSCNVPLVLETVTVGNYQAWKCDPDAPNTSPDWQDVPGMERCAGSGGPIDGLPRIGNTTGVEKQQVDTNTESPTYQQTRWIYSGDNALACPMYYYQSEQRTWTLQKSNCPPGQTGTTVNYVIPAESFQHLGSVAEANILRDNYGNAHAQAVINGTEVNDPYGNIAGTCINDDGYTWIRNDSDQAIIVYDANNTAQLVAANTLIKAAHNPNGTDLQLIGIMAKKANGNAFVFEDNMKAYVLRCNGSGQTTGPVPNSDGNGVSPISVGINNYAGQALTDANSQYAPSVNQYTVANQHFVFVFDEMPPPPAPSKFTLSVTVNGQPSSDTNKLSKGGSIVCTITRDPEDPAVEGNFTLTLQGIMGTSGAGAGGANPMEGIAVLANQSSVTHTFSNVTWLSTMNNPGLNIAISEFGGDNSAVAIEGGGEPVYIVLDT